MRYKSRTSSSAVEVDMTPMIDMTFQLIAFFMVLLNFGEGEQDARINLPASALAKPPEQAFEAPLVLQLTKEGNVLFAGEERSIPAIRPILERERQLLVRTGKNPAEATVIIRADLATKTGQVQELIRECQTVGKFETFVLRAKNEEAGGP